MKALSGTVCGIERSPIRAIFDSAARFADAIHLEIGQPDFPTPQHVIEAAVHAARHAYTGYTANSGMQELRDAVVIKLARDNEINVAPGNVMITIGAMQAVFGSMAVLLNPGDEILLPDPGYGNFHMAAQVLSAVPRPYPTLAEQGFVPDFEALESMITERTKALLICSPSNPTGAVFSPEVMRACLDFCRRHDIYLISDETYDQLVFEGEHVSPKVWDEEGRVISIYSVSKTYSMTGWRVGYAVASEEIIRAMTKIQEPIVSCVNTVAQHAAVAALVGNQESAREMMEHYRHRRDLAVEVAREQGLAFSYPHGAFYLLIDISAYPGDSVSFCQELLEQEHVAVAPGSSFGSLCENYVRISLCCSDDTIREGLTKLAQFLNESSGQPTTEAAQVSQPA